jgi:hypothetical protein
VTEVQTSWVAQLPPRMRAAIEREDARAAIAARAEEQEREAAAEEWQARNMALARSAAEVRGEEVSFLALARGEVRGRSIGDVLAAAAAAGDAQDARDRARACRDGDAVAHVFVDEPVLHYNRGEAGLAISRRALQFAARVRARKAAEAAELAEMNQIPLERTVELKPRRDDVVYVSPTMRAGALESGDRRAGGPEPGVGPRNISWAQVQQWLAAGWRP